MTYEEQAEQISILMKAHLGVGGKSLEARLRRAGRLLPRSTRRDISQLIEAVQMQANPKLARMVDEIAVRRAFENSRAYLQTIDISKRRKDRALGLLTAVAFNIFFVGALFIGVLAWRGLL